MGTGPQTISSLFRISETAVPSRPYTLCAYVLTYSMISRPFPYHPFGAAVSYSNVADSECRRLQTLWETFAQEASSS